VVARESDLGRNDMQFYTRTHLGHVLKAGDTCLAYDLQNSNWNDADVESMRGRDMPDVVCGRTLSLILSLSLCLSYHACPDVMRMNR
jgi:hypothetical protein